MVSVVSFQESNNQIQDLRPNQSANIYHPPLVFPLELPAQPDEPLALLKSQPEAPIPISKEWFPGPSGLTHPLQYHISSVKFCPFGPTTLAAGCEKGVLLWKIFTEKARDQTVPLIEGESNAWMELLAVDGLEGVSCIEWSLCSRYLFVGYKDSVSLVVWDTVTLTPTILTRGSFRGTDHLLSINEGKYLLQTCGNQFSIWETETWNVKLMSTNSKITNIIWINGTRNILFTIKGSFKIYCLQIKNNLETLSAPDIELPQLDLPRIDTHLSLEIKEIKLDPKNKRLAVAFVNGKVGLFRFRMNPLPDLEPIIDFAGQFEGGSLLATEIEKESKKKTQPHFALYTAYISETVPQQDRGSRWIVNNIKLFNMINDQYKSVTDPALFKYLVDQKIDALNKVF
ncbi:hypothetical protein HK103_002579 [Boothiomyces macroporosus]|uniref:Uncharacterized protein n=1 Tax=Boothiomyces macroporosus TaxID=261099 RepID=A0AAD5UCZ2_9FUNG|nr:hypothetical protein HK103_002579 [Boothiomyces macroporosus]